MDAGKEGHKEMSALYESSLGNLHRRLCYYRLVDVEGPKELVKEMEEVFAKTQQEEWRVQAKTEQARLLKAYVNEVWLSELGEPDSNADTTVLLEHILTDDKVAFENELKKTGYKGDCDKLYKTIKQLYNTTDELFAAWPTMEVPDITLDLCCSIHSDLMEGLVEHAGHLRKIDVAAFGTTTTYAGHKQVPDRLAALLDATQEAYAEATTLERALEIGAWFIAEFLLIHPFEDGNGRTARLLLSLMLSKFTVVPVSLYIPSVDGESARMRYINLIQRVQNGRKLDRLQFLGFVCECTNRTATNLETLLFG